MSYVGITMPDAFPSIYTATKLAATRLASAYHHAYQVPVSHVRAFNVFGPGQAHGPGHPQKIIPTFATAAWKNEPLPIWGAGFQTVDLVHVDDVARMLVDALNFGEDEVFDAGTGHATQVVEVAQMVIDSIESRSPIEFLPMRKGEVPTDIVAHGDGWDQLGWQPIFDLGKFNETLDWYGNDHAANSLAS